MNPFTEAIDWIDDNADVMGPIGAFLGIGIALVLGFILQ